MDDRDRAFLQEMAQFTYMNHIATLHLLEKVLRGGSNELEDVALACLSAMKPSESKEVLSQSVQSNNDAARIERIVVAKMYAEMMTTYEDLGALGSAIRSRANGGVFARYLKSSTGEAATFFDEVLKLDIPSNPETTLDQIIGLPPLSSFTSSLPTNLQDALKYDYEEIPKHLYAVAQQYREQGNALGQTLSVSSAPVSAWTDDLNVLLDIVTPSTSPLKAGVLARAFNKIKHRFMVTDNLPAYAGPASSDAVEYGRIPLDPMFVARFFINTVAAAGSMAELAALVIHLDQNGVTL